MYRHIRHGAAGFSFVELLVTIVIAAVVFAAMVPVFVSATQKNSADSVRLQAANVAQDKIEKIRQLPYGSITAANLSAAVPPPAPLPVFADGQFGPSTTLDTGSGSRKIYTDYEVTLFPADATGLTSQYKIVTVTAYWVAPPAPVKKVVLSTIVYRQYAGPPITRFSTDPVIDGTGRIGGIDLALVTLSARVDMLSGVTPASVQFRIASNGGQTVVSKKVTTANLDQASGFWYDGNGTFNWQWNCATAPSGGYDFAATAYSTDGISGNTVHQYPIIQHTTLPEPPGSVVATPGSIAGAGKLAVMVSWVLSSTPDVLSYEVFRATSESGPWNDAAKIATVDQPSAAYRDTSALEVGTSYFYAVRARTAQGVGAFAVSNAATPIISTDTTPPNAPTSPTAASVVGAGAIQLTWSAASDPNPNRTGVLGYEIWRSDDGVDWGTSPLIKFWSSLTSLAYSDATVGWGTTRYYRIRAVDVPLNEGAWSSPVVHATTGTPATHSLTIVLTTGRTASACSVWVLQAANRHYYDTLGNDKGTTPPSPTYIPQGDSKVFNSLPDGQYTVFCDWTSGATSSTFGVIVQDPDARLTGVGP